MLTQEEVNKRYSKEQILSAIEGSIKNNIPVYLLKLDWE